MVASQALEQLGTMLSPAPSVQADAPASTVVAHLPLELIVAPPLNRRLREPDVADPNLDTLVESLSQNGLLHPIGVRPLDSGRFELVYGGRRLAAARQLGWQTIAASLHMQMGEEPALVAGLAENLHRRDLGPRERAAALRLLAQIHKPGVQLGGYSTGGHAAILPPPRQPGSSGDLARKLGVDVSTVTRLAALGRDEQLLELVETGELGLTAASHVARVPPSLRQDVLEDVRGGQLSANKTHLLVNRVLRSRSVPATAQAKKTDQHWATSGLRRLRIALGVMVAVESVETPEEHLVLAQIADHVQRLRSLPTTA